jgi:hypothetical protein
LHSGVIELDREEVMIEMPMKKKKAAKKSKKRK